MWTQIQVWIATVYIDIPVANIICVLAFFDAIASQAGFGLRRFSMLVYIYIVLEPDIITNAQIQIVWWFAPLLSIECLAWSENFIIIYYDFPNKSFGELERRPRLLGHWFVVGGVWCKKVDQYQLSGNAKMRNLWFELLHEFVA